jgi:hypothetical protein
MLDVEALAVGVEHQMPLVLIVQQGRSGALVQLSFQQSHARASDAGRMITTGAVMNRSTFVRCTPGSIGMF